MLGSRHDEVIERLERGSHGMDLLPMGEQKGNEKTLARIASILRPFARLVRPSGGEDVSRIQTSLIRAGYRNDNAVEVFLGVKLLLTPIAILVLWQINVHLDEPYEFPMSFAVALIACAIAFFLPNIWVWNKATNRKMGLEQPLPDAIDLLVTCVEAGLSLDAAMARVSQEMELVAPLLASELKQTMLEIQAGVKRSDAFHRLSHRTGVEDLKSLSAMIIQTEMFGTSVSRALAGAFGRDAHQAHAARGRKGRDGLGQDDGAAHLLHPPVADGRRDGARGVDDHRQIMTRTRRLQALALFALFASTGAFGACATPGGATRAETPTDLARMKMARGARLARRLGGGLRASDRAPSTAARRSRGAHLARGRLPRAWSLPDAEVDLRAALKLAPASPDAHAALGILFDMQMRPGAEAEHREAVRLAPNNPVYLNNLGFSLFLREHFKEAIREYEKAARIAPLSHRVRTNMGYAYAALGDLPSAAREFRMGGSEVDATNNLGFAYERRGDMANAYDLYLQAVRIDPTAVRPRSNLVHAAVVLGRPIPAEVAAAPGPVSSSSSSSAPTPPLSKEPVATP